MAGRLNYLGDLRIKNAYGGWVRNIQDPETIGIRIDKENVATLMNYFVEYLRGDEDNPIVLTIYRKNENDAGLRTTVNIPY